MSFGIKLVIVFKWILMFTMVLSIPINCEHPK